MVLEIRKRMSSNINFYKRNNKLFCMVEKLLKDVENDGSTSLKVVMMEFPSHTLFDMSRSDPI